MQSPARLALIQERVETVNPSRSIGFRPRLVSATNGDASPTERANQSSACLRYGPIRGASRALEEGRGSALVTRSRSPRVLFSPTDSPPTPQQHGCSEAGGQFRARACQAATFGKSSGRARKVLSEGEHAREWLCISAQVAEHRARVAVHHRPGRWDPHPCSSARTLCTRVPPPLQDLSQECFWRKAVGGGSSGNMLVQLLRGVHDSARWGVAGVSL